MVQFECPVLQGTATVTFGAPESVTEPGPEADPCRPAGPVAYIHIGRSTVDCNNKMECGLTDAATGKTDWEGCPAYIAMRDTDSLQSLPGSRIVR